MFIIDLDCPPIGWTPNKKIKTCKCERCGVRVRYKSVTCNKCARHMCSYCLDSTSDRDVYFKRTAADHVTKGCWCRYRSNMNPLFTELERPPTHKEDPSQRRAAVRSHKAKGTRARKRKTRGEQHEPPQPPNIGPAIEVSDDDDSMEEEQYPAQQTVAVYRPKREGVMQKMYAEHDEEGDVGSSNGAVLQEVFAPVIPVEEENVQIIESISSLNEAWTVIVGAGVVGLFTARELAMQARQAGIAHHIVVVELRKSYCELASAHCAGFLSTRGLSEEWNALSSEAKEWWYEIVSSGEVRERFDFDPDTRYEVSKDGKVLESDLASWIKEDKKWSMSTDAHAIGRINSSNLAVWLYESCEALGVKFCFDHAVTGVNLTPEPTLTSVAIEHASDETPSTAIECTSLILCAGPFTTGILHHLLPSVLPDLENHVQGSDWFHVKMDGAGNIDDGAIRFPNAAQGEERLQGEVVVRPQVQEKVLAISGLTSNIRNKDLQPGLVKTPGRGKTSELKDVAAKLLNPAHVDLDSKLDIVDRGRSELSVANGLRPIIDMVPVSAIESSKASTMNGGRGSGIWLCYGFGQHGTMLAPGAAKLLVSKMLGRVSEDDNFRVPAAPKPRPKGKGKQRAV